MKEGLKIAISGKSGCGNTTVSRIVAERLEFKLINYTFRNMAEEKGIPFNEFRKLVEIDFSYDKYLDKKQVELASAGNCVLGSRLAIWMLTDADLKVFLKASTKVRASRIHEREGGELEDKIRETRDRDDKDTARYKKIYNIDNNNYAFADLIINVENFDQFQIADKIIEAAGKII